MLILPTYRRILDNASCRRLGIELAHSSSAIKRGLTDRRVISRHAAEGAGQIATYFFHRDKAEGVGHEQNENASTVLLVLTYLLGLARLRVDQW